MTLQTNWVAHGESEPKSRLRLFHARDKRPPSRGEGLDSKEGTLPFRSPELFESRLAEGEVSFRDED